MTKKKKKRQEVKLSSSVLQQYLLFNATVTISPSYLKAVSF